MTVIVPPVIVPELALNTNPVDEFVDESKLLRSSPYVLLIERPVKLDVVDKNGDWTSMTAVVIPVLTQ